MNQRKRKDSRNSAEREYKNGFENLAKQRSDKSLFQLALEVEDLLDKQKLKRDLSGIRIRTGYIE
jgi:hypothetical protein